MSDLFDAMPDAERKEWQERFRRARIREAQMNKVLVQSLKNLIFFVGGSHAAGWVEEAERAAEHGDVVDYE